MISPYYTTWKPGTVPAIDCEATGTDFWHGCRPYLFTACDGAYDYWWEGRVDPYTREVHWDPKVLKDFVDFLHSFSRYCFHNSGFDIRAIESLDINMDHIWEMYDDTLLMSHILCSGESHGLKDLAIKYLDRWNSEERAVRDLIQGLRNKYKQEYDIARKGHPHFPGADKPHWKQDMWLERTHLERQGHMLDPEDPKSTKTLEYALVDTQDTWLLRQLFQDELNNSGRLEYDQYEIYLKRLQMPRITNKMQNYGLPFHKKEADETLQGMVFEREQLNLALIETSGHRINWDSDQQLRNVIYGTYGMPVIEETKGGLPALDKDTVEKLKDMLDDTDDEYERKRDTFEMLAERQKLNTEISYLQGYSNWSTLHINKSVSWRLHGTYNPTGTRTVRKSSTSPNLQNIGKGFLKGFFGPNEGRVWMDLDFVNIELRIWAYYVNNKEFVAAFENDQSVHMLIAEQLYPELVAKHGDDFKRIYESTYYQWVKNGNFSRIYGATMKKGDRTYRKEGACAIIDKRFPEIEGFIREVDREVKTNQKKMGIPCVHTEPGQYRLAVPANETFKGCNYKIQGGKGFVVSHVQEGVDEYLEAKEIDGYMCSEVHDSLIIDLPDEDYTYNTVIPELAQVIQMSAEEYVRTCPIDFTVILPPNRWNYKPLKGASWQEDVEYQKQSNSSNIFIAS